MHIANILMVAMNQLDSFNLFLLLFLFIIWFVHVQSYHNFFYQHNQKVSLEMFNMTCTNQFNKQKENAKNDSKYARIQFNIVTRRKRERG